MSGFRPRILPQSYVFCCFANIIYFVNLVRYTSAHHNVRTCLVSYSNAGEKELSLTWRVGAATSRTASESGSQTPGYIEEEKESLGEKKGRACRKGFCSSRRSSRRRCSNRSRQSARDSNRRQEQQLLAGAAGAEAAAGATAAAVAATGAVSQPGTVTAVRSNSCWQERQPQQEQQPRQEQKPRQEQQLLAAAAATSGTAAVGRSSSCGQERQEQQPSTRAAAVGRSSSHQIQKSLEIRGPGRRGFTHEKLFINILGGPSIYTDKDSFHTQIKLLVKLSTYLCPNCSLLFLIWCLLCT